MDLPAGDEVRQHADRALDQVVGVLVPGAADALLVARRVAPSPLFRGQEEHPLLRLGQARVGGELEAREEAALVDRDHDPPVVAEGLDHVPQQLSRADAVALRLAPDGRVAREVLLGRRDDPVVVDLGEELLELLEELRHDAVEEVEVVAKDLGRDLLEELAVVVAQRAVALLELADQVVADLHPQPPAGRVAVAGRVVELELLEELGVALEVGLAQLLGLVLLGELGQLLAHALLELEGLLEARARAGAAVEAVAVPVREVVVLLLALANDLHQPSRLEGGQGLGGRPPSHDLAQTLAGVIGRGVVVVRELQVGAQLGLAQLAEPAVEPIPRQLDVGLGVVRSAVSRCAARLRANAHRAGPPVVARWTSILAIGRVLRQRARATGSNRHPQAAPERAGAASRRPLTALCAGATRPRGPPRGRAPARGPWTRPWARRPGPARPLRPGSRA